MAAPSEQSGWETEKALSYEKIPGTTRVAILDAGAQYVDLIQKACTRLGYASDILPLDTPFRDIENHYKAFLLSGGPANSHGEDAPMPDPDLWGTEKGVMGICYGQHAMALAFGGRVESGTRRQDGSITTHVDTKHPLFERVKPNIEALFTHGDFVTEAPKDFSIIGQHELTTGGSDSFQVISAMAKDNFVSVQFHPEVFDDMCHLQPDEELLEQLTEIAVENRKASIGEQIGDRHVIAFLSGGIDSSVAFELAAQVIPPERLHGYYFDIGFMRDEDDFVVEDFQARGYNVTKVDAVEDFEQATIDLEDGTTSLPLIEVTSPKIKRKIIGKRFADYKDEIAASLDLDTAQVMLLQGTNAADRIESGFSLSGGQVTEQIKEHHNQVKEIKDIEAAGLLAEPLSNIHKDEIRRIGEYLGLPEEIVWRHPFPGPGDAIRILGYKKGEYDMPAEELQEMLADFINKQGLGENFSSLVLPHRSVGVSGDARSYVAPAAIAGDIDNWEAMEFLAEAIPGNFRNDINRVVYTLGSSALGTPKLIERALERPWRAQLRHANRIVFEEMRAWNLIKKLGQFPVISLPLSFDSNDSSSVVLRPVLTSTYMTAKALMPGRHIDPAFGTTISERLIHEVPGISQVFYEITGKPPGTIEWE